MMYTIIMSDTSPEVPYEALGQNRSLIERTLGRLVGGDSISIPRQGGGVRVAVFPFNPENPLSAIEKTIALKRGREACVMPFDDPNYRADSAGIDLA